MRFNFIFLFITYVSALFSDDVSSQIEHILEKIPTAQVGISVISLEDGSDIYAKDAEKNFMPGSIVKLFTLGVAFDLLTPSYRFTTKLYTDGKIKKEVLEGNLYLRASGNPAFSFSDLETLVLQLKEKGIRRIKGDLILDLGVFDEVEMGPGWMWDEPRAFWNTQVSALVVNHNCVDIVVNPGVEPSASAKINLMPSDYFSVVNAAKTVEGTANASIKIKAVDEKIEVLGGISKDIEVKKISFPVHNPARYAKHLFFSSLKKQHIEITGKAYDGKNQRQLLAKHTSAPLSQIAKLMMKKSDNLYADALFKKIASEKFGKPGTWENGKRCMDLFLKENLPSLYNNLILLDGSGMTRYNLLSPNHAVTFLKWIYEKSLYKAEFMQALAQSGVDGTLQNRFISSTLMKGEIRAKTGTQSNITSIAGYMTSKKGKDLAFAIIIYGFLKRESEIKREIEDAICKIIWESN